MRESGTTKRDVEQETAGSTRGMPAPDNLCRLELDHAFTGWDNSTIKMINGCVHPIPCGMDRSSYGRCCNQGVQSERASVGGGFGVGGEGVLGDKPNKESVQGTLDGNVFTSMSGLKEHHG